MVKDDKEIVYEQVRKRLIKDVMEVSPGVYSVTLGVHDVDGWEEFYVYKYYHHLHHELNRERLQNVIQKRFGFDEDESLTIANRVYASLF